MSMPKKPHMRRSSLHRQDTPIGDHQLISAINRTTVLRVVRDYGPVTRPEISKITGLSSTTATFTVNDLVDSGLLRVASQGVRSVGRPPVFFELEENSRFAIGIQIEQSYLRASLVNLKAETLTTVKKPCDATHVTDTLDTLAELIQSLLATIDNHRILGIGISSPGQVDSNEGIVVRAMNTGWAHVHIARELDARGIKLPISVDNDANLAALAEQGFGASESVHDLVFITIGTGVGAGLIINGRIYSGASFDAGEIGHLIVTQNGRQCICGERGCLEAQVSEPALKQIYQERGGQPDKPLEDIIEGAIAGDRIASQVLQEASENLAIGISNIVQVVNPQVVIISGAITAAEGILLPTIERLLKNRFRNKATIRTSQFGDRAPMIGAAGRVIQRFFEPPSTEQWS